MNGINLDRLKRIYGTMNTTTYPSRSLEMKSPMVEPEENVQSEKIFHVGLGRLKRRKQMSQVPKFDDAATSINGSRPRLTKVLAVDCECVGAGHAGEIDILSRVSIVNSRCECVYDEYVLPTQEITDYRTHLSGIRSSDLLNAKPFRTVRKKVYEIFRNRIIVGYSVANDFWVLKLSHPEKFTRDTAKRALFCSIRMYKTPSLKSLADYFLDGTIQDGEHDSVIDAGTCMKLYNLDKKNWEADVAEHWKSKQNELSNIFD